MYKRDPDRLRAHPLAKLSAGQLQLLEQSHHLGHPFKSWFGQILHEGVQYVLLVITDQSVEALQLKPAPGLRVGRSHYHRGAKLFEIRR